MKFSLRKRHFLYGAIIILVLLISVGAVGWLNGWFAEHTKAEFETARDVTLYLRDHGTMPSDAGVLKWEMGALDEGIAVHLTRIWTEEPDRKMEYADAAFWVNGKEIFAVNEEARERAPDLPQAPDNITYQRVREVVH